MSPSALERRFPSRLEDLSDVMLEVSRFLDAAGIRGQAAYVTNLAVEELATNILKYGYDDDDLHEIRLRVDIQNGVVRVILEDDGHPFNPLDVPEPDLHLPLETRPTGGLGLHLVRQLAGRMVYERCDGRNRVTVEIRSANES